MAPRLVVHRLGSLPPLAWCARVESSRVDLWCGAWVEAGDDFFWEGAWAGDFGAGGFARCPDRTGSGGRVTADGLLLVPPSHAVERIHLVRGKQRAFASNSLPFVLAAAGVELDPRYPFYRDDLWSVLRGARKCAHRLPTRGAPVELLRVDPVLLGAGPRPLPAPEWRTYDEYRANLADAVRTLFANADDPARRHRFAPVATLSRGYDSPAAAALRARRAASTRSRSAKATRTWRTPRCTTTPARRSHATSGCACGRSTTIARRSPRRRRPRSPRAATRSTSSSRRSSRTCAAVCWSRVSAARRRGTWIPRGRSTRSRAATPAARGSASGACARGSCTSRRR